MKIITRKAKVISIASVAILVMLTVQAQAYVVFTGTIAPLRADSATYAASGHTNMNELEMGRALYYDAGYVEMEFTLDVHLLSGWKASVFIDERTMNDGAWTFVSQSGFYSNDISSRNSRLDLWIDIKYPTGYSYVEDRGTVKIRMHVDQPFPDDHGFYVTLKLYNANGAEVSSSTEQYYVQNIMFGSWRDLPLLPG